MLFAKYLLNARDANTDTSVVGELRDLDEEPGTLRADSCSTLSAVVLSLKETELDFADIAIMDLFIHP